MLTLSAREDMPTFAPGALVRARGRDWVVVDPSANGAMLLRPVDGLQDQLTGILPDLEPGAITETAYDLPNPTKAGRAVRVASRHHRPRI